MPFVTSKILKGEQYVEGIPGFVSLEDANSIHREAAAWLASYVPLRTVLHNHDVRKE